MMIKTRNNGSPKKGPNRSINSSRASRVGSLTDQFNTLSIYNRQVNSSQISRKKKMLVTSSKSKLKDANLINSVLKV